jgi:hypothetical protein
MDTTSYSDRLKNFSLSPYVYRADEGNRFLRNVGECLLMDTTSYSDRLKNFSLSPYVYREDEGSRFLRNVGKSVRCQKTQNLLYRSKVTLYGGLLLNLRRYKDVIFYNNVLIILSLLYSVHRVSFPGVKRPGSGVNHSLQSSAEVKEIIELYPSFSFGPSWRFLGRSLLLYI